MASIAARNIAPASGETITIRSAQADDAARLLAHVRAAAVETPFFIIEAEEFNFSDEQERQWIQDHLDRPGKLALLAEAAGEVVGVLSFENGPYRRLAHRGNFGLSVRKEWRGRGIGTALVGNPHRLGGGQPVDREDRPGGLRQQPAGPPPLPEVRLRGGRAAAKGTETRPWAVHG